MEPARGPQGTLAAARSPRRGATTGASSRPRRPDRRRPRSRPRCSRPAGPARLAGDPTAAAAGCSRRPSPAAPPTGRRGPRALERLGCFLWEAGLTARSRAAYVDAAGLLGPEVTAVHAQVWGALARAALIMAEFDEAIRMADRAVAAAREHGTIAVLADALTTRGTAGAFIGRRRRPRRPARGRRARPRRRGPGRPLPRLREPDPRVRVQRLPGRGLRRGTGGAGLLPEYGLELAVGAALACNAVNMLGPARALRAVRDGARRPARRPDGPGAGSAPAPRARRAAAAHGRPRRCAGEPGRRGRRPAGRRRAGGRRRARRGDRRAARPGGRPRRAAYRTVDEALRRLAGTQDIRFRTELAGDRAAQRGRPARSAARAAGSALRRRGWTGWPPSWTALDAAGGRRRRPGRAPPHRPQRAGPCAGTATADGLAGGGRALAGGAAPPRRRPTACSAQAECHVDAKRREQGRGRGHGGA